MPRDWDKCVKTKPLITLEACAIHNFSFPGVLRLQVNVGLSCQSK